MFILAIIYIIILVVYGLFDARRAPEAPPNRYNGLAQFVLFIILGIAVFWNVIAK